MIIILLFILILGYNFGDNWGWSFDWFGAFLGGVFGLFLGIGAAWFIGLSFNYHFELYETKSLVSLKDNQGVRGSFWLYGGYADSKPVYYYMKEEEGGYKLDKVSANQTVVYESNTEIPRLEYYMAHFDNKHVALFAIPNSLGKYKIYIPENSITKEFQIDLQ